ncbi:MAG: hypothetical protein ACJ761_10210 [Chloroflexota bacterium]
MPTPRQRFIDYPTNQLLAVVDDPTRAAALVAELRQAGFPAEDVVILRGIEGAERIDGMGASNGLTARLRRLFAFTLMDQLPDFVLYERALRDGRAVIAVRARRDEQKRRAHAILRASGSHFANYYGRFATEELDLWRGPEPEMPGLLRR